METTVRELEEKRTRKGTGGREVVYINGHAVWKGDDNIAAKDLAGCLTGLGLDARELRRTAWRRER